jgi:hypothetical protein
MTADKVDEEMENTYYFSAHRHHSHYNAVVD